MFVTDPDPALGERLTPPKHRWGADPVPPDVAHQLIHDELLLDGSAQLNLATFVTTWAEPQARVPVAECVDKNMIDEDEYPKTAELERRCVAMLTDLWHAPDPEQATGCSTTGSSEACMLAGLALQRRWAARVGPHPTPQPGEGRERAAVGAMPEFRLLSRGDELPVFASTTTDRAPDDVYAVSRVLRQRGWHVPAYTFPADREDLSVLRVVCRNGFSHDLADLFLADLRAVTSELVAAGHGASAASGFHH